MDAIAEEQEESRIVGYELSPEQKRIWNVADRGAVQCRISLRGKVSPATVSDALALLVSRHEILRTTFVQPTEGEALQVILGEVPTEISAISLRHLDGKLRDQEIARLSATEASTRGSRGLGLKALLVESAPGEYECILTLDPMYSDQRGLDYLATSFAHCYERASGGDGNEDIVQYADFAAWHNECLSSETAELGRAFWKEKRRAAGAHPQLPYESGTIREEPAPQKSVSSVVDPALSVEIEEASRVLGSGPGEFVLLAWQVVLFRNTRQSPGQININVDQRTEGATIGLFSRWLPINVQMADSQRFSSCLRELTSSVTQASEWVDYYAPQGQGHSVGFEFLDEASPSRVSGTRIEIVDRFVPAPQFKLCLLCARSETAWKLSLQYDSGIFTDEQAQSLLSQTIEVLRSATANTEYIIDDLALMDARAGAELLAELNRTQSDYPREASLQTLFEAQAASYPGQVALRLDGDSLKYSELNEFANRVARRLAALGVRPSEPVGLCLERGFDAYAALLGIIKAGCAYVPIDCDCPRARAELMARDADFHIVLVDAAGAALFEGLDVQSLEIRQLLEEGAPCGNPPCYTAADSPAYIMYTSGSTGKPKGICIPHRGITRLVVNTNYVSIGQGDTVANVSNWAFDAATFEVWGALLNGATAWIVRREVVLSPQDFRMALSSEHITAMVLTSALFNQMAQVCPDAFGSVDTLMIGGEALNPVWVGEVLASPARPSRLLNAYGPTESTTVATTFEVREVAAGCDAIPIGAAIANTEVYVLDRCLRPVPPGVPGELFIAGDGLAIEYYNDPPKTAANFVLNPFGPAGSRMYRTGDLARLRFDRQIDFLGRNDDQVKVRGIRIELAEIEAAMTMHPRIAAAAVMLRADPDGTKKLVGYYVDSMCADGDLKSADVRTFLATRLPEYMMPTLFLRLSTLPLTLNGKVDRTQLANVPLTSDRAGDAVTQAPRNQLERQLVDVWRKVLKVEKIGIEDNFFELGGDSIMSMRVVTEARKCGVFVTAKQFLHAQTIAQLALVATLGTAGADEHSRPIGGLLGLSPSQQWHFDGDVPDPHHYNIGIELQPVEELNSELFAAAVEAVFRHHDALRLQFVVGPEGWRQVAAEHPPEGIFRFVDLSHLGSESDRRLAREQTIGEIQGSLDHLNGPLTRFVYFRSQEGDSGRLVVVTHHLAADAVSLRVLLEDLSTAYRQLKSGSTIDLLPQGASFTRWADYVNRRVREGALDGEVEYWNEALSSASTSIRSDCDLDSNEQDVEQWSRSLVARLDPDATRAVVNGLPAALEAQLSEILLAAFARAYARWNSDRSVFLNLSIHGRQEFDDGAPDISRTVGWFSTIAPLQLDDCGHDRFADDLAGVKRQLAQLPRGGAGYQMIRHLAPDSVHRRTVRALPSAPVCFAYLGRFDEQAIGASLFEKMQTAGGPARGPRNRRRHMLEVFVGVTDQHLEVECNFSGLRYKDETILALLDEITSTLLSLNAEVAVS